MSFYNLRKFHNWIKNRLLKIYAKNVNNLLDLASGKGGDISKWNENNIKNVIGYDIDHDSIIEAKKRLKVLHPITSIKFYELDLSKNVVYSKIPRYDIITSMFAFHYFFRTKKTFNIIKQSLNENLKIGGYFIGSLFDSESVKLQLKKGFTDPSKFNVISKSSKRKNKSYFGNKINVYLKGTVLDKPTDEYTVSFNFLVNELRKDGYILIESEMFNVIYPEWKTESKKLNKIEKEISFMNRYFVFKRINLF